MPSMHLTQRAVGKLVAPHPDGKQTIYWDDELRGFGVQCSGKTNQRLYIAQRDVNGKSRRVTLGTVTGLTLEEARRRAEDVLDDLRRGLDPKKKEKSYTLMEALTEYLGPKEKKNEHPSLRPASVALYWQAERLLKPWLDRQLREITFEMVDRKHKELASEIGESTANLAMRILRIVWNYAADRSTLPDCPVAKLRKRWYPEPRRTRCVSFEQLPTFYQSVRRLDNPAVRDYILLMLFTGMRRREAASLRWSNVDMAQKLIRLPREVTKAKRAMELPMSTAIFDMLVARRQMVNGSPFVFPGSGEKTGHVTSADRAFEEIEKATGIKVSAHDMRRTFASVAADTDGVSWIALKVMMNHTTKGDVTAGYVQISNDQLRHAVQRVADRIAGLCGVASVADQKVAKLR
ncbi:integrase family protein [Bradyrhizobium sp. SZCCHNR3058]|uniref:tyrosine-type recombinase/integrase n=1 Tax=Bradyrhizobium sp. SZCCHNR3058 TaxID=3057423 RepID=UPI002916FC60|nr:integrase family protein [Bradyrhizobium sp. SZCCHNR3058]